MLATKLANLKLSNTVGPCCKKCVKNSTCHECFALPRSEICWSGKFIKRAELFWLMWGVL